MRINKYFETTLIVTLQLELVAESLKLPTIFSNHFLPQFVKDRGQHFDHLGSIIRLDTYFKPTDADKISAKFSIHNRRQAVTDIAFTPNGKYCSTDPEYHAVSSA